MSSKQKKGKKKKSEKGVVFVNPFSQPSVSERKAYLTRMKGRAKEQKMGKRVKVKNLYKYSSPGVSVVSQGKAPVAKPYVLRGGAPKIGGASGNYPVVHGEYLQDLVVNLNNSAMSTVTYNLNCALQDSFPWLGVIGGNWEYYQIMSMVFEYVPVTSTAKPGDVSMCINYDARESSFSSIEQFMAYQGSATGSLYNRLNMAFRPPFEAKKRYYCRTTVQPSDTDIREYDAGNFQIRIDNAEVVPNNTTYGRLLVKYSVKFSVPRPNQAAEGQLSYYQSTGISGLTRTNNYGGTGIPYNDPTYLNLAGQWSMNDPINPVTNVQTSLPLTNGFYLDPGVWRVDYGTRGASGVSPWIPAGTAGSGVGLDANVASLLETYYSIDNIVGGSATWTYMIRTIARTFIAWSFSAGSNGYAGLFLDIVPGLMSWLTFFPGSATLDSQELKPEVVEKMGLKKVYRKNWGQKALKEASARIERLEKMLDSDRKGEEKDVYVHVSRETVRAQSPVALEDVGYVSKPATFCGNPPSQQSTVRSGSQTRK